MHGMSCSGNCPHGFDKRKPRWNVFFLSTTLGGEYDLTSSLSGTLLENCHMLEDCIAQDGGPLFAADYETIAGCFDSRIYFVAYLPYLKIFERRFYRVPPWLQDVFPICWNLIWSNSRAVSTRRAQFKFQQALFGMMPVSCLSFIKICICASCVWQHAISLS